ncbi:piggyBac transposable element-derived protein 4-like, partial [Aphis craccivora]
MSRNRFLLILRALHFGHPNENQNDRLFRIQPILNYFNNKMDDIYYPEKNLSIDESMILWRSKRHKFGIKLYMLTESAGLNLRMFIYCGQKLTKIYRPQVISHTEDVVMSLMKGKLNNGHSLYMDNFYNSVDLAHKLLLKQTYCTGTLRMNRKNNPKEVTSKKLKTGELISKYTNDGICVFKWKDKREVLGLSTEWKADLENVKNRKGDEKEKPVPIINYNKFMSGVDRQDQMLSYYPCERKTLRWYKKVFIHITQQLLLNAYFLYCKNERKISFYSFRLAVIRELLQKSQEQPLSSTLSDNKNMHAPELLPK